MMEKEKSNSIPKDLEYKLFGFDISSINKENKDGEELGVFYGAMATQHKDRGNDIIAPDAFNGSLSRYKKANRDITLFFQHNHGELPIGIIPIKSVEEVGKKWNVKGELNLETQMGREVYSLMKQGALTDLSIGFTIKEEEWKGETRIIKELELWEVSVVSEPANAKATVTEIKAAIEGKAEEKSEDVTQPNKYELKDIEHISTKKEFNEILSKSGLFSRGACEFLASRFTPKGQSKSVDNENELDHSKVLADLEEIINKL
jgi:HK97 family phage prohead protease